MLEKKHYNLNETYKEEFNLIVGVSYGSEGIIPCHRDCCVSCVGSSGENFCGEYCGHKEIEVEGTKLYLVYCSKNFNCIE